MYLRDLKIAIRDRLESQIPTAAVYIAVDSKTIDPTADVEIAILTKNISFGDPDGVAGAQQDKTTSIQLLLFTRALSAPDGEEGTDADTLIEVINESLAGYAVEYRELYPKSVKYLRPFRGYYVFTITYIYPDVLCHIEPEETGPLVKQIDWTNASTGETVTISSEED